MTDHDNNHANAVAAQLRLAEENGTLPEDTEGSGYVCDGCDGRFNLEEVFVNRTTDSVKCPDCMTPEDRIID